MGRPIWSGSITFGLVTVPVELVSAQRRARPALRMLSPSGHFLRRTYACPREDRPLRETEIERGYEVRKGKFVLVTDEELERLAPRSSRDIDLVQFVERTAIDPRYFVRSYYVLPAAGQTKAYRLLAAILEESGRAGLARFVMRGKGHAVALFGEGGLLRAETLRFHDELRDPAALGAGKQKSDRARVRRIQAAVRKLAARSLHPRHLADEDTQRMLEVARAKKRADEDVVRVKAPPEPDEETRGEVIDLVAILRERLRGGRGKPRKGAGRGPKRPRKKAAGRATSSAKARTKRTKRASGGGTRRRAAARRPPA